MKIILLAMCYMVLTTITVNAMDFESEVEKSLELLKTDREQCLIFTKSLLKQADIADHSFALVKTNYILGYIEKARGDYGKAVLYYLDGIRHAKSSNYEGASKDLINLLQNTGNVFKRFNNFDLAKKYYSEAMEIASENRDFQKFTFLVLLTAKVLSLENDYSEAANLLESTFPNFNRVKKKTIADIYNQLGLIYTESSDEQAALDNFNKLLILAQTDTANLKTYIGRAYHNIGNLYFTIEEYQQAIEHFRNAIQFKENNDAPVKSKFFSYKDISESFIKVGQYDSASFYLQNAEQLYQYALDVSKSYEIYKFKSLICLKRGDLDGYARNQELYSNILEKNHEEQRQIEATDKKYNLDLITDRYFALVAEQERNQQIQYYSAVGGSFLVSLIVLIIAFFQYRKYRLRKDLEASLRPYIKNAL